MKKRVRFASIPLGYSFDWASQTFTKTGSRNATSNQSHSSFIFSSKDLVTVEVPDYCDDFGDVVAVNPQDYFDSHPNCGDRCN